MNEQEQRIAIAEYLYRGKGDLEIFLSPPHLPDYLNDLNAMHEAEKVLSKPEHSSYICQLYYKTMGLGKGICDWQQLAGATAAQRAEAFLKTLNLWTS